jgi:uncharacterized membrane protein
MKFRKLNPAWQAITLGALSGMRSVAGPAIASHLLSNRVSYKFSKTPLAFMQTKNVSGALKVFAATESVADKMPFTPNRTDAPGLAVRFLAGALAGASVYKANAGNQYIGAVLGGAAALASTFGSFTCVKPLLKKQKLPTL